MTITISMRYEALRRLLEFTQDMLDAFDQRKELGRSCELSAWYSEEDGWEVDFTDRFDPAEMEYDNFVRVL